MNMKNVSASQILSSVGLWGKVFIVLYFIRFFRLGTPACLGIKEAMNRLKPAGEQ